MFGGASGSGPDSPQSQLDALLATGNVVQFYDNDPSTNARPNYEDNPNFDPSKGNYFIDQIATNSNPSSAWNIQYADVFNIAGGLRWNETDQRLYRAMTLVHELAHLWAYEHGLQNGFEKPDGDPTIQLRVLNRLAIN